MKALYMNTALAAVAFVASTSIASAACISGCEPTDSGGSTTGDSGGSYGSGTTFSGGAYFQGVTGGMFTTPDSGFGLIEADKEGGSDIAVNIIDGGFCSGDDCSSIQVDGDVSAYENGYANGNATGAESDEVVLVNTGGLFGAGSSLTLLNDGSGQMATATGSANFENNGGGVFSGEEGGVNVTSYGTGGVNTDVGYKGDGCGLTCGDITGGVQSYGTAGMTVDAFGSSSLAGMNVLVENGGSSYVGVGTGTGFQDVSVAK